MRRRAGESLAGMSLQPNEANVIKRAREVSPALGEAFAKSLQTMLAADF
jgi:hypothetical protein